MTNEYPIDRLNRFLGQRREVINSLVEGLQSKIGTRVPDDAVISTFILIARELGNFYRVFELQTNLMIAMQKNMEVVALQAYNAEGEEAKEVINILHKELFDAIENTTEKLNTEDS
ncbi:MAG: hypothetical protein ACRD8W_10795 [Nitrososphaeraceae archaeon]